MAIRRLTSEFGTDLIAEGDIATGAITTDKIAADAITSTKIAANAVTTEQIVDTTTVSNLVCGTTISNVTVTTASTTALIVGMTVSGTEITAGTTIATIPTATSFTLSAVALATNGTASLTFVSGITAGKIAADAVGTTAIAAGAIGATELGTTLDLSSHTVTVPAATVTAHVVAFDDSKIRHDITTLALREAVTENRVAYNLPNSFIDQFQDDSGIATEIDVDRNASEYVSTTGTGPFTSAYVTVDREAATSKQVTVSSSVLWQYDQIHLHEGSSSAAGTVATSTYPNTDVATNAHIHRIDLWAGGSGPYDFIVDGYKFFGEGSNTGQTPAGKVQGSHDASTWVDISQSIANIFVTPAYPSTPQEVIFSPVHHVVYRYIQFVKTSGQISNTGYWNEIQLKERVPSTLNATGTVISTTTADASVKTKVSGVLLYKDAFGTATFGSAAGDDLEIQVTCDGTNYATVASYTAVTPVFSAGIKMVKLGETTCTNDDSSSVIGYKALWRNQVFSIIDTQLHGIGLNY